MSALLFLCAGICLGISMHVAATSATLCTWPLVLACVLSVLALCAATPEDHFEPWSWRQLVRL